MIRRNSSKLRVNYAPELETAITTIARDPELGLGPDLGDVPSPEPISEEGLDEGSNYDDPVSSETSDADTLGEMECHIGEPTYACTCSKYCNPNGVPAIGSNNNVGSPDKQGKGKSMWSRSQNSKRLRMFQPGSKGGEFNMPLKAHLY